MTLDGLKLSRSRIIQLLTLSHDLLAGVLAILLGLVLRIGDDALAIIATAPFVASLAVFVVLLAFVSTGFGLNRGLWRYASLPDLVAIVKTATIGTLGFLAIMFVFSRLDDVPRTSLIIAWALMILLMAGTRVAYRLWRNRRTQRLSIGQLEPEIAVLVGADGGSEMFIKAVHEQPNMAYRIAAILDERDRRTGMRMRGVPVIGSLEELDRIVAKLAGDGVAVRSLIITKHQSAFQRGALDEIIEWAALNQCRLMRAPDLHDVAEENQAGGVASIEPTPVKIEDLLGRPPAHLPTDALEALISDMTVLVTGAGGSIGSELCRQVLAYRPKRLVLVDLSEYALYAIDGDLADAAKERGTEIVARLGDVRDVDEIDALFAAFRPDLVFHAAALKHVPIVEFQPMAGLRTNVLGTRNVADCARKWRAKAMVLISTDKAVNPTNVMGATKRVAELYCQAHDLSSQTRYVTVRFGNVLGSSGSVVPLFERQIRAGGPLTVTHPEISRYFMTIPEASQLVLHAMQTALESERYRGHLHILDMGQPVKIVDLARRMIMLSGLRPNVDVDIVFTGLRPGEKLFEELFTPSEQQIGTSCDGVLVGSTPPKDPDGVYSLIEDLLAAVGQGNEAAALALLAEAVPEADLDIDRMLRTTGAQAPLPLH